MGGQFTDGVLLNGVMAPPFITSDINFTDQAATQNVEAYKTVRIWAEKGCRVKTYPQDGSAKNGDTGMPLGDGGSYEFKTSVATTISVIRITESGFLAVTLKD